jgi:hypothetical protein
MRFIPPPDRASDQYSDLLQNLEWVIVRHFRAHPALQDWNINKVLEAIERFNKARRDGKAEPKLRLNDLEMVLFQELQQVNAWFLGQSQRPAAVLEGNHALPIPSMIPVGLDIVILCAERLMRSIKTWRDYGVRGYLDYVDGFF